VNIEDLTINEILEVLKTKLETNNINKIKELESKVEKEKKRYLKSLQYFKNRLKELENDNT
jgi:hypothetical protein